MRIDFDDDSLFVAGRKVTLALGEKRIETEIELCRNQHGRWVMALEGIGSIEEVEEWIGARIEIPKTELPAAPTGTWYSFDIEGCTVYWKDEPVGPVTRLIDYGATSLLQVDRDGVEVLIPFAEAYLENVDVEAKRIDVDLPDGLIELNEPKRGS